MRLPYYPWYPTDFLGDSRVSRMPVLARMAYRELLDISWQEGPLTDPELLLEGLGLDTDLWRFIRPCWIETAEGWIQKRLEKERASAQQRHESSSRAGKASGKARRERTLSKRSTAVEQALNDRGRSTNQNQTQSQCEEEKPPARAGDSRLVGGKRAQSRKPSRAEALEEFDRRPMLTAIPGLRDEVGRWRDRLPAKKVWASLEALQHHLDLLETRPTDAVAAVRLAADNEWTNPLYAFENLDRENQIRGKNHERNNRRARRADGTRTGEPAEPTRTIREL